MKIIYECEPCQRRTEHNQISYQKDSNYFRCNQCGHEVVLTDFDIELSDLENEIITEDLAR